MQRQRIEALQKLSPRVRQSTLEALDEISRPLTRDELDHALAPYLFKSQRRAAVEALANLDIIAIVYAAESA